MGSSSGRRRLEERVIRAAEQALADKDYVTPIDVFVGLDYVARTRDRRHLRFSVSGDPDIERAYRTHWVAPELSERKHQRVVERASGPPDLVVVSPSGPAPDAKAPAGC